MRAIKLFLVLTFFLSINSAYSFERIFTFEEEEVNLPPKGIVVETPAPSRPLIVVQKEEEVDKPNKILALCGSRFPGVNYFSGVVHFSNIQNGKLSIRFKHTGEVKTVRTIGLVWRKSDTAVYSLDLDTTRSRISITKDIKTKREKFEEEKVQVSAGEWHTLSVEFRDDEIHGFIDNQEVIKGKDDNVIEPGKVGFFIQSNTIILADDFKIQGDEIK
jgi:hypothetical protein